MGGGTDSRSRWWKWGMSKQAAEEVLVTREFYPDKALADLYDPDKMPQDLREVHARLDDIVSTGPNTLGYSLSKDKDEVIRFPENHPDALSIIRKLFRVNDSQWAPPSYDIIEEEFDLDDFYDEYHYQGNYGREVVFHTHRACY